ncbi:glycosyltransferase [Prochlorococcus marinus]|uniref:glycosyltransferase n=1 Tax=Prochlorococcus marinus TaxID=1219 RepID=UPI001ADA1439|nr:glycosyltransferase [Prochlorococcus marinus]MBO8221437.1 glycosyltransferase [Prochlorococcus marinus CUG1417]MBW3074247.1 hypothetical protein [Prochlorococcus marinus str. MU1417]
MRHKVCILYINWKNPGGVEKYANTLKKILSNKYDINLIKIEIHNINKSNLFLINWFYKIKYFIKLQEKLKTYNLVISFSQLPALVSVFSSKKHIFFMSGSSFNYRESNIISKFYWAYFLQPIIFLKTSAIVPAAPHLIPKQIKRSYLAKKIYYINGLIDLKELINKFSSESNLNLKLKKIGKYICLSSAILKHKGIIEFINIFNSYIKFYNPKIKLIILGNGPILNDCKLICNKLSISWSTNLQDRKNKNTSIFFLGYKKNPLEYIKNSKAFVFPSFDEGLSNQLLEAILCNVPIIATNCPGNKFIVDTIKKIDSKNKPPIKLLPPLSSESSHKKWLQVIDNFINGNIIFKNKPRYKIIYKFSLEENSKKWINLTEGLLK